MNWPLLSGIGHFLYTYLRKTLKEARRKNPASIGPGTDMIKCSRCYIYVPVSTTLNARVGGYTIHFCSPECFEAYRRDHREIDTAELGGGRS